MTVKVGIKHFEVHFLRKPHFSWNGNFLFIAIFSQYLVLRVMTWFRRSTLIYLENLLDFFQVVAYESMQKIVISDLKISSKNVPILNETLPFFQT